jgi:hypothetical protein
VCEILVSVAGAFEIEIRGSATGSLRDKKSLRTAFAFLSIAKVGDSTS